MTNFDHDWGVCLIRGLTVLTLTTRCILIVRGNSNLIAFIEITLFTLYRPINCFVSFSILLLFICYFKSFVLSITKSPFWYSFPFFLFLSAYYFISSCTLFNTAFTFFWISFILSTSSPATLYLPFCLPSNPILGSCP